MFSNEDVAKYINDNFEPAWESVRPVPRVTIDFGNGKVVRRTLHGNVATYVTSADGRVLDVLPGIYQPQTYLDRLGEFQQLHTYVRQQRWGRVGEDVDERKVQQYHATQAAALKDNGKRAQFMMIEGDPRAIVRVESHLELVLEPHKRIQARGAVARGTFDKEDKLVSVESVDDLPEWQALAEDTAVNETVRRQQIHEYLTEAGPTTPDAMKKWLYREVLHADLEDPYLGLGKILFDSYPFAEEDAE